MLIWWSVKSVFDSEIIQALGTVAIEEIHNFNCIKFFSDLVTVFQLLLKLQLLHTFKLQLQLLLTGFTLHAHYTYMQRLWTSSVYRTWKILHIQVNILFSFFFDMWSKKRKKVKFFWIFKKKRKKNVFSNYGCDWFIKWCVSRHCLYISEAISCVKILMCCRTFSGWYFSIVGELWNLILVYSGFP